MTLSQSFPLGITGPSLRPSHWALQDPLPVRSTGYYRALSQSLPLGVIVDTLPASPSGRGPFPPFLLCATVTIYAPPSGYFITIQVPPSFCLFQHPPRLSLASCLQLIFKLCT